MDVPPETLRQVFMHLDGCSFVRCRRVCSFWLDVASNYEVTKIDFWRNRCIEEITWESMLNIIEKLFPNYVADNASEISWKAIYVCWHRWKSFRRWKSRCNDLKISASGELMCARFTGKWLLCGTRDFGGLVAYNMETFHMHPKPLIRCCTVQDFVFSNTSCIYSKNPDEFLDSEVMIKTDRAIHWFDLKRKRLTRTSEPSNTEKWLTVVNELFGKKLKALNPKMKEVRHSTHPANISLVVEGCSELHCIKKSLDKDCKHMSNHFDNVLFPHWIQLHYNVAMGFSMTSRNSVVFFVNGQCKMHLLTPDFGRVTTALIHANNFFVATDNGLLYHYNIDSLESFLDFNFSKFDWSTKVHAINNQNVILSIDVCELYDRPYIALAVGSRRIVIIDFMA